MLSSLLRWGGGGGGGFRREGMGRRGGTAGAERAIFFAKVGGRGWGEGLGGRGWGAGGEQQEQSVLSSLLR